MPTASLGKGALFVNDHKKPDSNQPDRRGMFKFDVDIKAGTEVDMSGWLKKDKNNATYLFIVANEKYVKPEQGGGAKAHNPPPF